MKESKILVSKIISKIILSQGEPFQCMHTKHIDQCELLETTRWRHYILCTNRNVAFVILVDNALFQLLGLLQTNIRQH